MANPYVNKVVYGGTTLIDLTADTVSPDKVAKGIIFHNPDGSSEVGTFENDIATIEETLDYIGGELNVPFAYGGLNAVKIAEYDEHWSLDDTSFVKGSSSSTSATSIKATVSNRFTNTNGSPNYAYNDDDIVVIQTCTVKPTYDGTEANTLKQLAYVIQHVSYFSKRKTTDTSAKTTRQVVSFSSYINKYYNPSGVLTRALANYGFYMTPQAPTVANTTAATTYVRCGSPVLYYRVSTSYMSADNIKKVTECDFDWHIDVYTVDLSSTPMGKICDAIDGIVCNI